MCRKHQFSQSNNYKKLICHQGPHNHAVSVKIFVNCCTTAQIIKLHLRRLAVSERPQRSLKVIRNGVIHFLVVFGFWARIGPRNHVLYGGPYAPMEEAILRGKRRPFVKYSDILPWAVQKRLNRSRCHLRFGPRNHVLDGEPDRPMQKCDF